MVFIQPPDLGIFFNNSGDKANNTKGEASPNPKPNIPMIGLINCPEAPNPKSVPTNGPVQENDTNAKVNAIKKIPIKPPLSDCASTLLTNFEGSCISNKPKNDNPKIIKMVKKRRFGIQCVLIKLGAACPNVAAITVPNST